MTPDHSEGASPDAALVRALARLAGVPIADDAMAERVAGGAAGAIDAVRKARQADLFDQEPSGFLPALERLAEPECTVDARRAP
jgi:hypothetical protein